MCLEWRVRHSRLDHTDPAQAAAICELLVAAYTVEAQLIGVTDFAPLRRTADDIAAAASTFVGGSADGRLVAVAELEELGTEAVHIASFAVHPAVFRRGIGHGLLRHVLEAVGPGRVTVSTAAANRPAIALYEKGGFAISRRWEIEGIDMVTLARGGKR
jgi:ribosomal protein S18 acetylase RimI-like enzyme